LCHRILDDVQAEAARTNASPMSMKHRLTDEAFVLLQGKCTLLVDVSAANNHEDIKPVEMKAGKVYCVHKGIWHNMIMSKDAKLILVENANTSADNSEMYTLTEAEIKVIQDTLKLRWIIR
jgi:mannose-6-phosphate isomerase-like protein (cupin superfamily)